MKGPMDDTEALVGGFTKTQDDSMSKRGRNKKFFFKYSLFIAISGFALLGVISVAQGLQKLTNNQRSTWSLTAGGGDTPLETNDPNNVFDGHINSNQIRSIGKVSKFLGVEPNGGEKTIRKLLENVADTSTPFSENDIPFHWEVGGFGNLADSFCRCFQINMATTFGIDEAGDSEMLQAMPSSTGKCNVYNANLGTNAGILRASNLGLITEVVPDYISSPFLPEIASLFTSERKGRIIISVPNINARIGMSFGYLQSKGLIAGSFLEFVSSNHILANNYMTHMLSGKWGGVQELTEEDFNLAVEILKEKFIVTRWSDNRKTSQYIIKNVNWPQSGFDCMYPPESVYSHQAQVETETKPSPPPPEKTPEEIAAATAIDLHNQFDNRLFNIMNEQASIQLAEIE